MRRPLSLTSRLTLFFTVAAALVVAGLAAWVMMATERHFLELDRVSLQDKQRLISDILADAESAEDGRRRLHEALSHHHGLFIAIGDAHGAVLFQSPGFRPPHRASASPSASPDTDPMHSLRHWRDGDQAFRGLSFQATPAFAAASRFDVLIAMDIAHHTQFMRDLGRSLLLYAATAVALCGLLGWLAAHRALAPLRTMRYRAAIVTSQQLDERMPVAAVPAEMADLAVALNGMLDRLQDAFRRLSEFSSDLAHELRTPLSNLMMQTQVALSARRGADDYRDILASNAEELQRLARMVSDMLFLAKTERALDLPHRERFSAATEVRALIEFYEVLAEEKHIALNHVGEGEVFGDRLMFRRAVSNLLSNALAHTGEHGEITITIDRCAQTTRVVVENTGEDIDPHILPRLFDRFYRADPSRAHPGSDGAGLGLAIVRAIVEAHGGTIETESGGGRTRFGLCFPAVPQISPGQRQPARP